MSNRIKPKPRVGCNPKTGMSTDGSRIANSGKGRFQQKKSGTISRPLSRNRNVTVYGFMRSNRFKPRFKTVTCSRHSYTVAVPASTNKVWCENGKHYFNC
jgi:hypothetical protein